MPRITDRQGRPFSGQMPGLVEGIVVDNVDPDRLGRVKVKFPSLPAAGPDGGSSPLSYWARVATPSAGKQRGWVTIPEMDDEVLVAFLHGDIQHAVVIGALYNGVDVPPYANQDSHNNLRTFVSRSGHAVIFDDTPGLERITLRTHNEEVLICWNAADRVLLVRAGANIIVEAKETITVRCRDFQLDAYNSVSMTAGETISIESGKQATIYGGKQLILKSSLTRIN